MSLQEEGEEPDECLMSMFFLPLNELGLLPANKLPDETVELLVSNSFGFLSFCRSFGTTTSLSQRDTHIVCTQCTTCPAVQSLH